MKGMHRKKEEQLEFFYLMRWKRGDVEKRKKNSALPTDFVVVPSDPHTHNQRKTTYQKSK